MSEEQACLVRARSDSDNSANQGSFGSLTRTMTYTQDKLNTTEASGEPAAANQINLVVTPPDSTAETEIGELLDYNDDDVLDQFHEDAIRQAGCGMSQLRVILACTLALLGASLELCAIQFVLPSAEIELCVQPEERDWLVLISLTGCLFGSIGWSSLSARLGRRRSLLSCLAVNAVFATIAAFMPTYGTFMMARFCSAFGSGGILPLCYSYLWEMCGRGWIRAALAGTVLAAGGGSLLAALLAAAVLPGDGAATLAENREHFSAWHRYLLLCTLPIVAALISLIWTQESPRYLLDVGREVDAMCVYQAIHSSNQMRIFGKGNVAAAPTEAEYRLGELSLPGKRRPPALHHVRHSVKMYWQTYCQIFGPVHGIPTILFFAIFSFLIMPHYFLAGYVPFSVVAKEQVVYEASTATIENSTFTGQYYNTTIQNTIYENTVFRNSSFRDLLMFHVQFWNCSFYEVAMANVKSSRTSFHGCLFVNTTLIDTDMEAGVEFDEWCVFNNTVIRGMKGGCARHADLTSKLSGLITEQTYIAHATFVAALFAPLPDRLRPSAPFCFAMLLLSPSFYLTTSETTLYAIEAIYRALTAVLFLNKSLRIYKAYPASLRCTTHGLIIGCCYILAMGAWDAGVKTARHPDQASLCVGFISVILTMATLKTRFLPSF